MKWFGMIVGVAMLLLAGCGDAGKKDGCDAGDTKQADDGCNTCYCDEFGQWSCTEIACNETCTDGEVKDAGDGCNTCSCQDNQWLCTLIACPAVCPEPVDYTGACVAQVVYVEGTDGTCCEMPDPCSVPDGMRVYNTKKACEAGPTTCTDGESRPAGDGCNTCTCVDGSDWACTEIACQPGACQSDDDCMVTGCSGQICAPEPVASTCEFLPEYACYRDDITSCGCNDGVCGWAQTEALATCLGE